MCCRDELQRNARHSTAGDITVTASPEPALVTGLPLGLQFVEEREEREEEAIINNETKQ